MALGGCSRASRPEPSLPDVKLQTLAGPPGKSLASCPTAKCLTIVVAPWCPYCRASTPQLIEFRKYLKEKNVYSRVVVGMDKPQALRDYAVVFGPDTLLDPDGALSAGGVPHFFVSNSAGEVTKDVPGMPQIRDNGELAAYFEVLP